MLSNINNGLTRMARNVVLNHPNSYSCQVFRKKVNRVGESTVDGNPTLGGLAVLDNVDEEDFEYSFLGDGAAMRAETFAAAPLMDRQDANYGASDEVRFLIEPVAQSGEPNWFDVRTHDVMYLLLGDDPQPAMIAFEVVGIETTSDIPPYTNRYICNRRDDLHVAAGEDGPGEEG